ncbi:MAG: hypothetical protein QOI38_1738, partial [Sphingomonadales bacterium]|nr:hypothetical protein [Sphingomonadales bacterium]
MTRLSIIAGALIAAALSGCTTSRRAETVPAEAGPQVASTQLRDAGGRTVAAASVTGMGDAVRIRV